MQNENLIWNYEKYRQIVKSYRGKKTDDGITLINLSFVYEYLARTTRIATDSAFQSWAKKSSPGPTQSSLMQLEKYWNTCLTIEKENQNKEKKTMSHYNQFVAEHTYNIIKIIKNFIHSEEVDDEDTFLQMTHSIEVESFCIPEELECMFNDYIDEKLEPIIYNHTELFGEKPQFEDFVKYVIEAELEFNELINKQIRPRLV